MSSKEKQSKAAKKSKGHGDCPVNTPLPCRVCRVVRSGAAPSSGMGTQTGVTHCSEHVHRTLPTQAAQHFH